MSKFKEKILANQIVLIIFKREDYQSKFNQLMKDLNESISKTLFICLNQPYKSTLRTLQKNQIDLSRFTFLDTLTMTVQNPAPEENCVFVSSPSSLTEISVQVSKIIAEKKCESIIFDSVNTLSVYQDENTIIRFLHSFLTKIRMSEIKMIFTVLKDEKSSVLIQELFPLVDSVIDTKTPQQE